MVKSYYQWHRRTLLGRFCVWVMAIMVMALQCLPGYLALTYADEPAEEASETAAESTTDSTTASTSSAEDGEVEGEVEDKSLGQPLPPALLTLGVRAGEEGLFEGVGDILLPIWYTHDNGLLFVSPRASFTDNDEQEYNIGLGFRQHVVCRHDREAIIGVNAFYDSRYSANDNQFDQFGFGAEFLTKNVDARFNYYLPDDKEEVIDEFTRETSTSSTSSSSSSKIVKTGAVVPEGNDFVQDVTVRTTTRTTTTTTTTRFHFKRFEAALEGWDAEIGLLIPGLEDILETRVFIGYQSFDNPFGEDFEGIKGRVEIRALPGVFLDGEWFEEDELNGTDFFVGARVQVPVDLVNLVNGKNPFEGAGDNFKKSKESTLLDRIAREQVIRDPRVQTVESEAIEQEEMRETIVSKSTKTKNSDEEDEVVILNDIEFVDSDHVGPEDGTFENPWNSFDEAIAAAEAEGTSIYVFDKGITYTGSSTLDMADGTVFLGSGKAVYGLGGKKYTAPAATHPTISGPGTGPIVAMGEDTTVGGLRLINPGAASGLVVITGSASGTPYDVTRAAIIAEDKSGLTIMDNLFDDVTYAAVLVDTLSGSSDAFEAMVMGNEIQSLGAVSGGVVIDTKGASGTFDVSIVDNDFSGTGGDGLFVDALVYDDSTLYIENLTASSNADDGADITLDDNAQTVSLSILTGTFALNGDVGIQIRDLYAGYMASATFGNISASHNVYHGIHFMGGGAATDTGAASMVFHNVSASRNGWIWGNGSGIYIDGDGAYSDSGSASVAFSALSLGNNADHGLYIDGDGAESGAGDSRFSLTDSEIAANGWFFADGHGVYINGDAADSSGSGDATVTFSSLTLRGNTVHGLYVNGHGADANGTGDASLTMNQLTVISNGFGTGDGIGLYVNGHGSTADGGSASTMLTSITMHTNQDHGLFINGHGAEAGGAGATALLVMQNISASPNGWGTADGIGLYVNGHGATADSGSATTRISNVQIHDNPDHGIFINGAGARASGDAWFSLTDSSFTGNGFGTGDGIGVYINGEAAYSFSGGDATAVFDPLTFSGNADDGLLIFSTGARSLGGGDAMLLVDKVTANNNGFGTGDGIGIHISGEGASADGGSATAIFTDITVTGNQDHGLFINGMGAYAGGAGATATLIINGISASPNGWGTADGIGVYVDGHGAYASSGSGSATTRISNVHINGNPSHGLYINGDGALAAGDTWFSLTDSSFEGSGFGTIDGVGVYISGNAAYSFMGGDATALFDPLTISRNAGHGLYIDGNGARAMGGGNARLIMDKLTVYNNGWGGTADGMGIHISSDGAYAGGGDASATFTYITVTANANHGLYINGDGADAGGAGANALLVMSNISASPNGWGTGSGNAIYINGSGALDAGGTGSATARISNVAADGIAGYALKIVGDGAIAGGDAYFSLTDADFDGNGWGTADGGSVFIDGRAAASFSGGDATAVFDGVTTTGDADTGIVILGDGAQAIGGGDASFTMNEVSGINNGWGPGIAPGILISGDAAYSAAGSASAMLTAITVTGNAGHGLQISGDGAEAGTHALLVMDGISSGPNGFGLGTGHGVFIDGNGAAAFAGSATARVSNVEASGNANNGFFINGYGATAGGDAYFSLINSEFIGNGFNAGSGSGFYVDGDAAFSFAGGDATAYFDPITASGNAGSGLFIQGYGARATAVGGDAALYMEVITASGNLGGYGIYFGNSVVHADSGHAYANIDHISASSNGQYGFWTGGYGAYVDAQGDASFYLNDLYLDANGSSDGLYFNNAVAHSGGNSAYASLTGITSTGNTGYGIRLNSHGAYARSTNAVGAMAVFTIGAYAVGNTADGVYVGGDGAHGEHNADATTFVQNLTASQNGGYGLYFYGYGAHATASGFKRVNGTFIMDNVSASHNTGGAGVFFSDAGGAAGSPAFSAYGSATARVSNVHAEYNSTHGVYIASYGARGTLGDASFTIDGLTVSHNGGYGIYFGDSVAYALVAGNAFADLKGISAAGNTEYGFFTPAYGAYSGTGDAYFSLGATVTGNGPDDGLYFRTTVAYAGSGSAYAIFDGLSITQQTGYGLFLANYGAYAGGGAGETAYFALKNSTLSGNGLDGVWIGSSPAYGTGGTDATAIFDPLSISNNGNMGINIRSRAASAYGGGVAKVWFDRVNASGNGDWGININGDATYADTGNAFSTFQYITTSFNGGSGININGSGAHSSGTGFAMVVMRYISSSFNEGRGININGEGADSLSGNASASFRNITTSYNEEEGININGEGTYAGDGFATTTFRYISSIMNGDEGVRINGDGAESDGGDANFSFLDSTVSFNGVTGTEDGLFINGSAAYAHDGDAYATFDPISASFNSGGGIVIDGYGAVAFGTSDDATFVMDQVSAQGNTLSGISLTYSPAYSGAGAGAVTLSHVAATGNGEYGFYIGYYGAYAQGASDSATFTVNHMTASYNTYSGLHIELTAANSVDGGDARTTFNNVTASYNGSYGVFFGDNAAYAGSTGTAAFVVTHLEVMSNTASGLESYGYAAYANGYGDAIVDFNYFTASYNGTMGLYFGYHAAYAGEGGDATVILRNGEAISNSDHGLYFYYTTAYALGGGNAYAKMENITATGNGTYGVYITDYFGYASEGSATGIVRNVNVSYNGDMGFYAEDNFVHSEGYGHNATAIIDGLSASYNARWGIAFEDSIAHQGVSGTARVMLSNISAGENGEDGFFVGDHGAYSYGYAGGGAYFEMTDGVFYGNGGYGMYFYESVAHGVNTGAHTVARFTNITASYSGAGGFYAGYGVYGYGTYSLLVMDDFYANYNADSGIYMVYGADQETATETLGSYAIFRNVQASYNSEYGMYFAAYGVLVDTAGDGVFSIEDSTFNGNADSGVYFDAAAVHADSGTGAFILSNVTASENTGHGIYSDGYGAYGEYGATLRVTDVTVYSNGGYGMFFETAGAYGGTGVGYARFSGFTSSFNGDDGLYFGGYGAAYSGGPGFTEFLFVESESSYNSGYGVYVAGTYAAFASSGDAQALWRNAVISGNSSGGVWNGGAYADGAGNFASTDIQQSNFEGNGGDGMNTTTYSDDGPANVRAIQTVFADNTGDGLQATVGTGSGSININLGRSTGGGGFSQGSNSIFGNGGFGVNNTGGGVGSIEDNFWGGGAPAAGTDYNGGGWTAPSSFRAADPN